MEWIRFSDKLPPKNTMFIIYHNIHSDGCRKAGKQKYYLIEGNDEERKLSDFKYAEHMWWLAIEKPCDDIISKPALC
jgi:hypothetical protein